MCGITGIISNNEVLGSRKTLEIMTEAIKLRGPDDDGIYEGVGKNGCYIGLGHRRLSIIDIDSGKQPLTNEDGSIFLVFNGEIYNYQELRDVLVVKGHKFKTSSDSEVIVHAYEEYGEDCVSHFRGMFAFAIWDSVNDSLFIARDRFGKKPLFYILQDNSILFSSEIKSFTKIQELKKEVNTSVIDDYLVYRYVPGPETLFKDILKLEPGSYATYFDGMFKQQKYYYPSDRRTYSMVRPTKDPIGKFLEILRESVSLRMISDVPFGAFLSGGIDSSAIVGLMTEYSQVPIKTFSVGFQESNYSELKYAEVIARQFKTDHHELNVSYDELIKYLPELVRYRDAPVSEPSDIPIYLLAKEASKTVKMVLTGEGSDEILGGYPKHVFERYARYYQIIPKVLRHRLLEPIVSSLPYRFRRAKTAIATLGIEDAVNRQPRWFGAISYKESRELLRLEGNFSKENWKRTPFLVDKAASPLRKILYFDQTSWLPDNLLERGDRMTMAASIEARMPFMDHELSEYVSSLQDNYRVRGRSTKWILREAVKHILPEKIVNRPKVGFRLPVNEWFRGPMKDYLYDNLMGDDSVSREYYRKDLLSKILKEHIDGRHNYEKLLWTMLNLEIWLKQNQGYNSQYGVG